MFEDHTVAAIVQEKIFKKHTNGLEQVYQEADANGNGEH